MSCVVPGCKSGYGGLNPENLHFFPIPNDPEGELLWKTAIKRKDRYAKSGKVVCEKHFLPEQILWEEKLLAPDDSELGMSQLKIPYLENGVVPSQFSWNAKSNSLQSQTPNFLSRNESSVVEIVVQQPIPNQDTVQSIKKENESSSTVPLQFPWDEKSLPLQLQTANLLATNESSVLEHIIQQPILKQEEVQSIEKENESTLTVNQNRSVEMQVNDDAIIADVTKASELQLNETVPFRIVELYTTELNLPPGWMKESTFWDRRSLMIYFRNQTFKIENAFRTVTWKAVTIKEDMSVEISILGEPLALKSFDISNVITSVEQLQSLLFTIHPLKVCSGCTGFSEKPEIDRLYGSMVTKDVTGTWRHIACTLLLSNTTTCQPCSLMRRRIESKLRKWKYDKTKNTEKEVVDFQDDKNELLKVNSKCRCAIRAKDESKKKIKRLQRMLRQRQLPVKLKNNEC